LEVINGCGEGRIIANNLKYLGYEKTLAVSRLNDIPKKVLNVLGRN